jgi:hypothetical protein
MAHLSHTEIEERDQANNIVATYIRSLGDRKRGEEGRIDVIVSRFLLADYLTMRKTVIKHKNRSQRIRIAMREGY